MVKLTGTNIVNLAITFREETQTKSGFFSSRYLNKLLMSELQYLATEILLFLISSSIISSTKTLALSREHIGHTRNDRYA